MFGSLFCLLLLSIIASSLIEIPIPSPFFSPYEGFFAGIVAYCLLLAALFRLGMIYQHWPKGRASLLAQGSILSFLLLAKFLLGAFQYPLHAHWFRSSQFLVSFCLFSSYFLALTIFHFGYEKKTSPWKLACEKSWETVRFILPFSIPYFVLLLVYDLWGLLPASKPDYLFPLLAGTTLLISLLFVPVILQKFWGCIPLLEGPLLEKLTNRCRECRFRHGGFKIWTPMKDVYTAAIVGILPRFRYILFTEKLLESFPPEEIEAIFIHEMGHSQRRHLLFYPFIVLGMVLCVFVLAVFFTPPLFAFFFLEELIHPGKGWQAVFPLVFIGSYIAGFVLYFRLVFGFFSRLFERQADIHIFSTTADPRAMPHALDRLACLTGYTHNHPNWHHDTLQNRIEFLRKAIGKPPLIERHHRLVRYWTRLYAAVLAILSLIFLATIAPELPLLRNLDSAINRSGLWAVSHATRSLKERAIEQVEREYGLRPYRRTIQTVVDQYLVVPSSFEMRGTFLLSLAAELYHQEAYEPCAKLLLSLWMQFPTPPPSLEKMLKQLTNLTRSQMMIHGMSDSPLFEALEK